MLSVRAAGIPVEMTRLRQWVLWRLEERDGDYAKVPYQCNGSKAAPNDSTTWATFAEVWEKYQSGDFSGIGFVFAPGGGLVGIDLDGCRNPDGTIDDWAVEILSEFPSYAEISPSGTGIKAFVMGSLPIEKTGARVRRPSAANGKNGKLPGIEAYHHGRFFAVTGHPCDGSLNQLQEYGEVLHDWFRRTFLSHENPRAESASSSPNKAGQFESSDIVTGERNENLTRLAGIMRRAGMTRDEILAALLKVNADRCKPPLSDSEARSIAASVSRYPPGPGSTTASMPLVLRAITSAELDSGDFNVAYHIREFIPVGQPGIIGAPSKALKTTLAAAGFMSVASGDPFLGRFQIEKPARACLISAESGFASLQRTARAIAVASGRSLSDYADLLWNDQILDLGNAAHIAELVRFTKDQGIRLLGLDPAYLMFPGMAERANSMFEVGSFLRSLTILGQECGCTIALVHHFRKGVGSKNQEPELDWLAHAGFGNWARWWWLLNRRSKYDPEEFGRHRLWLHAGGSAGHSSAFALDINEGLRSDAQWSVKILSATEAREEQAGKQPSKKSRNRKSKECAQDETGQKVINALREFHEAATTTDIAAVAGVPKLFATLLLRKLVASGDVVFLKAAIKKANHQCYDGFVMKEYYSGTPGQSQ